VAREKKRCAVVPVEVIAGRIFTVREQRVIIDSDLAPLYGVETKALTRAIRRNIDRFPPDFMFRLTKEEFEDLRRQFGTSRQWGGRRYPPYAFTEHGALMAANVLRSDHAAEMSVCVIRAFVQQRKLLANQEMLAEWLLQLQNQVDEHDGVIDSLLEQNEQLLVLVDLFRRLLPACERSEPFGFAAGTSAARKKAKRKKPKR